MESAPDPFLRASRPPMTPATSRSSCTTSTPSFGTPSPGVDALATSLAGLLAAPMYVVPDLRGRGIGSAVIDHFMTTCEAATAAGRKVTTAAVAL